MSRAWAKSCLAAQPRASQKSNTSVTAAICYARFEMKLPGGEHAIVDLAKLRDYCLNPLHPRGRHKARVFTSALGLTQSDAVLLSEELHRAARERQASAGADDEYGERYTVDFEFVGAGRRAIVRSAWMVRRGEQIPRLTSCFVLLD